MAQIESPVVPQRRLRAELRRARENAGLTQKGVADRLDWSSSKVIRIETGAVTIATSDLMALLQSYNITDPARIEELLAMAKASKQQAWWDDYRNDYPAQFITFLGFEASAATLRQFQALTIPGLLQIPDYARDLSRGFGTEPAKVERNVTIRGKRQQLLNQRDSPELLFVMDEAVLHRQVGGVVVWQRQLEHLLELNARPNISIQVLPFSVGAHPGMRGSFTVFEFPFKEDDPEDYAVLLEQPQQDVLFQNDIDLASQYLDIFFELQELAEPKNRLDRVINSLLRTGPSTPDNGAGATGGGDEG
jgi:transcriptional regulator with XRE-family HTH domain